jgi:septum formation topological specificity factor MinE
MLESEKPPVNPPVANRAKEIFAEAPEVCRDLIKLILQEERDVQHLQRRAAIHKEILDIIRRTVQ